MITGLVPPFTSTRDQVTSLRAFLRTSLLAFLILPAASGQLRSSATVTGILTDPSGAVIYNATVVLNCAESRPPVSTHTSRSGRYTLTSPPGFCTLSVTVPGFVPFESDKVQLSAARPVVLDIQLRIQAEAQQVDVDDSNALDTDPNHNGDSITLKGKAIDDLPLDSTQLLQELQGLAGSPSPDIYVDGFSGGSLPPRDTIREIRINQNPYSAENDTNPSNGQIQVFTKPGSNKFHGDLYAFGNDAALNTANPFVASQPPYDSFSEYGSLSGPIGKRSSFFLNAGNQNLRTNSLINAQTLDSGNNQVYVTTAVPSPLTSYSASGRLDRSIGEKSTVIFRYSFSQTDQTNGGIGELALASQGLDNYNTNHQIQISNSQILSPRIVNDTRFQYTRSRVSQYPNSNAPTISVSGAFTGGGNSASAYNDNQDRYELQNYVSATAGKQFFTFGGRFRATRDANHSTANYNGTYTFASLTLAPDCTPLTSCNSYQTTVQLLSLNPATPFAAIQAAGGGPSQFSITQGNPNVAVMVDDAALFFQDDWKARANLTVSGGLRFETQNVIADHADWAPRFGIAWGVRPRKGKAPLFTLRGGAGLFYSRFTSGYDLQAVRQNGITQQQYIIDDPRFYFPGASPPNLAGYLAGNQVQSTIYTIGPAYHAPYNISTTVAIERQLKTWGNVTVSYLANRGVHQQLTRNINAPLPGTYNPSIAGSGVRPFGGQQNIYEYESGGVFRQNRLSANFFLRFNSRYLLYGFYQLHYDTADTNGSFPSNQYNLAADQGRSANDIRHSAYIGASVQLPLGIELFSFTRAQSGSPFNITTGQDLNGDSIFNDRPAFATDLTRPSVVATRFGTFDTSPVAGQAIIPVNYGKGPGFFTVSINLNRNFEFGPEIKRAVGTPAPKLAPGQKPHIDRRYALDFGINVQNLFNQLNLAPRVGVLDSPLFGRSISLAPGSGSTYANRIVQLNTYFHF